MTPTYPIPWKTVFRLLWAAFSKNRRSFYQDARECVAGLCPPLRLYGDQHVPLAGPCLLTCNHYARSGFHAWWITLGISAVVPLEIHWTITAALTFTDPDGRKHPGHARLITPITRWILRRVAWIYGFTAMPSMPPDPAETVARARAVRQVLDYARRTPHPVVGLAPEGRDAPGGILQFPSAGAGRFVIHLARDCRQIIPIGVYEDGEALCLRFGPAYRLDIPPELPAVERDCQAIRMVMQAIAEQLPQHLRGQFI